MSSCDRLLNRIISEESGQILPMTLAALMLGIIVTAPFLTHAGASVTGSREYRLIINETYASEAGVEHAIWRLFDGDLAPQLPNINDSISYTLPNQVNNLTPYITVTKTGGISGASGEIADTVFSKFEFDTSDCYEPALVHVYGDVYAVAYRGPGSDGFIKTVTIAANGQIGNTVVDTLEFDTADGFEPALVHVSGDVYATAYRGTGSDGFIKTVTIAADGQIGDTVVDTLEFDTSDCDTPAIISISDDIYAIAYQGTNFDGFLSTIGISSGVATFQIDSVAGGCTITASVQLTDTGIKIASWEVQR